MDETAINPLTEALDDATVTGAVALITVAVLAHTILLIHRGTRGRAFLCGLATLAWFTAMPFAGMWRLGACAIGLLFTALAANGVRRVVAR